MPDRLKWNVSRVTPVHKWYAAVSVRSRISQWEHMGDMWYFSIISEYKVMTNFKKFGEHQSHIFQKHVSNLMHKVTLKFKPQGAFENFSCN